jgi:hypothetical protein
VVAAAPSERISVEEKECAYVTAAAHHETPSEKIPGRDGGGGWC